MPVSRGEQSGSVTIRISRVHFEAGWVGREGGGGVLILTHETPSLIMHLSIRTMMGRSDMPGLPWPRAAFHKNREYQLPISILAPLPSNYICHGSNGPPGEGGAVSFQQRTVHGGSKPQEDDSVVQRKWALMHTWYSR